MVAGVLRPLDQRLGFCQLAAQINFRCDRLSQLMHVASQKEGFGTLATFSKKHEGFPFASIVGFSVDAQGRCVRRCPQKSCEQTSLRTNSNIVTDLSNKNMLTIFFSQMHAVFTVWFERQADFLLFGDVSAHSEPPRQP